MVDGSYAFQCSATNHYSGAMHEDSITIVFSVTSAGIRTEYCIFARLKKAVMSAIYIYETNSVWCFFHI